MEDIQSRLQLTQLTAVDPHACSVVCAANRAYLYNYDSDSETWSKTDVEGILMIYTRNAKPKRMLTIVNRNSKTNLIEPITKNCDAQLKNPYVLLRNDKGKIMGIWFADHEDVQPIYEAIGEFIRLEEKENMTPVKNLMGNIEATDKLSVTPSNSGFMDIMSMLSKAHGEYETKQTDGADPKITPSNITNSVPPATLKVSPNKNKINLATADNLLYTKETSISQQEIAVADFFAKVGVGLGNSRSDQSLLLSSTRSSSVDNNDNAVLQQLFKGAAAVGGQASFANNNHINANPVPITVGLNDVKSPSFKCLTQSGQGAPMSLQELEGKLRENLSVSNTTTLELLESQVSGKDTFSIQQSTPKPSLLAPHVFAQSKEFDKSQAVKQSLEQLSCLPENNDPLAKLKMNTEINGSSFRILPQAPPGLTSVLSSTDRVVPDSSTPSSSASQLPELLSSKKVDINNALPRVGSLLDPKSQVYPLLTEDQFVLGFKQAITKESFLRQIYEAYEEAVMQKFNT